jgi:hypothetical protein
MNQSQLVRIVEASIEASVKFHIANPKPDPNRFAGKTLTAEEQVELEYNKVIDTHECFEKDGLTQYEVTINGHRVSTPWLTEDQLDVINTKNWQVFIGAFSSQKRLLMVNRIIVEIKDGVVTYPGGVHEPESIEDLFSEHGMQFTSVADLIELHLLGSITDTSITAKNKARVERAQAKAARVLAQVKKPVAGFTKAVVAKSAPKKIGQGRGFTLPAWKVEQIVGSNVNRW